MTVSAKRLSKIPPYLFGEIARLKENALREGKDLIDLGIGDPDQPTPTPIIEALCQAARRPETHRYDESVAGWPLFLDAVRSWFLNRFGVHLDTGNEILLLIGSKEGLTHLPWAVTNPGDIVLVPDPAYSAYYASSTLAGADAVRYPLKRELGWLPDLSDIPSETAKSAKLMYINYPNNPTGGTATREFYDEVTKYAQEYDIILCSDCAYSEVTFDGYKAPSILQSPGAKETAIEFHSLSKSFNMTGWRIGFAVGRPDVLSALNKLKGNIDSKQFPAVSEAGAFALLEGDNSSAINLLKKRRDILVDGLNSLGWKVNKPKGSFYVWADCPPGSTSMDFSKTLLEKAGVLVIPGTGYGPGGEGFVRMSTTVSGDKNGELIAQAITRIKNNIDIHW